MKFILLCGGIGKRCNYSLPKPLNYIKGKHMIEYIIQNIPSDEIHIIYNIILNNYNFKEIVINLFKQKKIFFYEIDYLTRGAVETAYIGINQFINIDENNEKILFIDNDNIHTFDNNFLYNANNSLFSFIGYGNDYEKTNYSFINIENDIITNIEEKIKISDNYCMVLKVLNYLKYMQKK
jgi:NDP-sugar pyrophosphorylase family protein